MKIKSRYLSIILAVLAVCEAGASGEEEKLPPFNPAGSGWQATALEKGFSRLRKTETKMYHALIKSGSAMRKEKIDILLRDFIAPSLELYAASGTGFTLIRDEAGGTWRAGLTVLSERTKYSLVRAVIYKTEDYGPDRLVTYKLSAYDQPFPVLSGQGSGQYVFRGYLAVPTASFPENGFFEYVMMRTLERLAEEGGAGLGAARLSGRAYLAEHRFVYVSKDLLGVYCKLAVEVD